MDLKRLNRTSFWLVVSATVTALTAMVFSYHDYEGTQRNLAQVQKDLIKHQIFQLDIKKQIVGQQLADALFNKKVNNDINAQHSRSNNINKVNLAESSHVRNSKKLNQNQLVAKRQTFKVKPSEKNEVLSYENEEKANVSMGLKNANYSENNSTRTFEPMAFIGLRKQQVSSNEIESIDFSSEFKKRSFCKSINWYTGISGGINGFAAQKDFQPAIESQISDFHYLLEDAELVSKSELSRTQFNVGVFVGAQLFNRLDIEGGVNYHYSSQEFSSVYGNLYREEFTYLEWVPTGSSNGTNGAPTYKPVETVDYLYKSAYDTINTVVTSSNIEIPLLIRYHFNFNRLSLFASIGASSMLFSSTTIESTMNGEGKVVSTSNIQSGNVNINGILGAGISYEILPHIEIRLEPLFRPNLYSNDEFLPKSNSNSTSFNAGIKYQF